MIALLFHLLAYFTQRGNRLGRASEGIAVPGCLSRVESSWGLAAPQLLCCVKARAPAVLPGSSGFGWQQGHSGWRKVGQDLPDCLEVQAAARGSGPILPLGQWMTGCGSVSGSWATDFPLPLPV